MVASRRVQDLNVDRLELLPPRCQRCLFWEIGAPRPADAVGEAPVDELAADPAMQKHAWWSAVGADGDAPGRVLRVDGTSVAYCAFAPARTYARRRLPVPPASDDALLLATAWVDPEARGAGVGRMLVQSAVKEAHRRGLRGVEAYGDRRHRDAACVLPCTWLVHEGFAVHREHPRYPLLRIDVKTTLRWAESLEEAVEAVLGRLARRAPSEVGEVARYDPRP